MKNLSFVVGIVSFSLLLSKPAQAFDAIYSFGDSTSDTGNVYATSTLLGDAIPPASFYGSIASTPPSNPSFIINPLYLLGSSTQPCIPNTPYLGRYSNGPNWIDDLSASLNIPLYDYAYGGANTGTTNIISSQLPGLQTEVKLFTSTLKGGSADPNALYTVWSGSNDLLFGKSPDPATSASNVATEVATLAALGAKNILVLNQPDLGELPYAKELGTVKPEYPTALSALTTAFNSDLSNDLAPLTSSVNLTQLDIHTSFENLLSIYSNSSTLKAANCITNAPNNDYSSTHYVNGCNSSNGNNYFFWDDVHPTSPVYSIIAQQALTNLGVPEPLTILGSITALGMAIGLKRKLRK